MCLWLNFGTGESSYASSRSFQEKAVLNEDIRQRMGR